MLSPYIEAVATWINDLAPHGTLLSMPFMIYGLMAVILIGLVCGGVGSLVVGNRMAFFSDALAHCAFAGIALGILVSILLNADPKDFIKWGLPILVSFGILMGLLIALVKEKTGQASDTVIAVFFAGAIGFGAIFLKAGAAKRFITAEAFMFGDLVNVNSDHIELLLILLVFVGILLAFFYNSLVFSSFNSSLAKSRGIQVRLCSYVFIIFLALIVNVVLMVVGVLLINALLIVPAAAAANLCRNMRQLFFCSVFLCIFCGVMGIWISWELQNNTRNFEPGESGTIVVMTVILYFLSIFLKPLLRNRKWLGHMEKEVPA